MNKVSACEFVNKVKRSLMEKIIILKSNHVTGKVDDYLIWAQKLFGENIRVFYAAYLEHCNLYICIGL